MAQAGSSTTAVWGDLDNDGWPELVVGNRGGDSRLYHNLQGEGFVDISAAAGLQTRELVQSVMLADVNLDGLLDIYFANLNTENALYINQGDLRFNNQIFASGATDRQIAMGSVFFDYDKDGDPDLYLVHDANQANILYQNDGTGRFRDVSRASGTDYRGQGMGVDVADINNDGYLDMYITNLYENTLLLNQGDGTFQNISATAGIEDPGMGWGVQFADVDNDGWTDVYVANDSYFPVNGTFYGNVLYQNLGNQLFSQASYGTPLFSPYAGYGLASLDANLDGALDFLVANSGQDGNQLLLNESPDAGNWVSVRLEGTQSNRSAVGARLELKAGDLLLTDELLAGSGFASQQSARLHFGLGSRSTVDQLTIYWPGGLVETYSQLPANQLLAFREGEGPLTHRSLHHQATIDLRVLPNPAPAGQATIALSVSEPIPSLQLRLLSSEGRVIARHLLHGLGPGTSHLSLQDLGYKRAQLPAGIYFLQVSTPNTPLLNKPFIVLGT